jgi:hypothetical protein
MKTIELTGNRQIELSGQRQAAEQLPVILVYGNRPVAALVPDYDKIVHLSKFQQVVESEETVTLTVGSHPVAILHLLAPLVMLEENGPVDLETINLSLHPRFLELIEKSRLRHAREGGISSTEMRKRFAKVATTP